MRPCLETYAPLFVLKPAATDVWIVDGPEVRMPYLGLRIPFTTRMTVVRLADGGLWLHSPIQLDDGLRAALEALGPVTCLVAPNSLHHVWLADWAALYPEAAVFVAPGLEKKVPGALAARARTLDDHPPAEWAEVIDQAAVLGDILNEICFFHRPSRTLVLTDLIENFEACRVCARWRWVVKLAGAADPHGSAPHDMRASFARRRGPLRAAVQRMIGWSPERVILAHGRWYDRDGTRELQRAFRWAL